MQSELKTRAEELNLEKPGVNFFKVRTQILVGLIGVFLVCLCHFASVITSGFGAGDFILYFCCSLLLALITLELTGKFGNRTGAGAAIWAALLFSSYPLNYQAISSLAALNPLLNCLFTLLTIFAFLRWRLLKESLYLKLAVLGIAGLLSSGSMTGLIYPLNHLANTVANPYSLYNQLNNFLLPNGLAAHSRIFSSLLALAYLVCLTLFCIKLGWQLPKVKSIAYLFMGLAIYTIFVQIFTGNSCSSSLYPALSFSLLLSLMALPAIDKLNRNQSKIIGSFGVLGLSIIFLLWTVLYLFYR